MSANTVVDQAMATAAGDGSVASLSYGAKIPAAVLSASRAWRSARRRSPHYANVRGDASLHGDGGLARRHAIQLAAAGVAVARCRSRLCLAAARAPPVRARVVPSRRHRARVGDSGASTPFRFPVLRRDRGRALPQRAGTRPHSSSPSRALNFVLNVAGNWVLLLQWIGLPGIALLDRRGLHGLGHRSSLASVPPRGAAGAPAGSDAVSVAPGLEHEDIHEVVLPVAPPARDARSTSRRMGPGSRSPSRRSRDSERRSSAHALSGPRSHTSIGRPNPIFGPVHELLREVAVQDLAQRPLGPAAPDASATGAGARRTRRRDGRGSARAPPGRTLMLVRSTFTRMSSGR